MSITNTSKDPLVREVIETKSGERVIKTQKPKRMYKTHKNTVGAIVRKVSIEEFLAPKIGRNSPCICGSGLKYKRCCL